MNSWNTQRADHFCKTVTDGTHDSPKVTKEGRKLITSKHLKEHFIDFESAKCISEEDYEEIILRSLVEQWDILFSMIGTVGNVYIEKNKETEYACKNVGIFKFGGNASNAYWLYYYLKSPQAQHYIQSHSRGTTQQYVPLATLRGLPVPIPPKEERDRIIGILKPIDDKIELNDRINANLEEQARAIFKSWFVDFEPFGGKMPEDWKRVPFEIIANVSSGKLPPMTSPKLTEEARIPFVGSTSILGYTNAANRNEKILTVGKVGTLGVVQRFNKPCWVSNNAFVITSPYHEYAYQILKRTDYMAMNRGSAQPYISYDDLNKKEVLLPDKQTLCRYESVVGTLMKRHENNITENEKLSSLRDALLPRLLSGELDVSKLTL